MNNLLNLNISLYLDFWKFLPGENFRKKHNGITFSTKAADRENFETVGVENN